MNPLLKSLFISLSLLLVMSGCCKKHPIRTVRLTGFTYTYEKYEPGEKPSFYMVYYIELSDTGEVRLMKRTEYKSPMEYYSIQMSDSLKQAILSLCTNDSLFRLRPKREDEVYVYDGPTYHIQYCIDTITRTALFIPPSGNFAQQRLAKIMDSLLHNHIIIQKASFSLKELASKIDRECRRLSPPLFPSRDTIIFFPPVIKPE